MRFENPAFLLLFIIPVLLFFLPFFRQRQKAGESTLRYSSLSELRSLNDPLVTKVHQARKWLRYLVFALIVITLARPQQVLEKREISSEGIDIMLLLDVSGSMQAEDFSARNRLEAAKETLHEFIRMRETDRIGLVVFGGVAFTLAPLTLDYEVLHSFVDRTYINMAGDGTAIGMAVATGLNRLKFSQSPSKVMILLTDGVNNRGEIDPITSGELARDLGVRIYTVGMGREGGSPLYYDDPIFGRVYLRQQDGSPLRSELDEAMLKKMASLTNGQYFLATDKQKLKEIYTTIDKLEKSEAKTTMYFQYHDYFPFLLWCVFAGLMAELALAGWMRTAIP